MTENSIRVQVVIFSWFSGALVPGLNSALLLEEELPVRLLIQRIALSFAMNNLSDVIENYLLV